MDDFDFVALISSLTQFVQNERVRAYNEGVDNTREQSEAQVRRLREALIQIVEEKCNYMHINNLGDPETQHTVKAARAALSN